MQAGKSFQDSFHITAYVGSDSYVYFRCEGPDAGGLYPGCTASGHRGRYSDCCRYEYAVLCHSGSSCGAAGEACQGVSDTSAVRVPRVASVVRTVVLVSLAHAAMGSSGGLVAALFAQPCSGGHSQDVPDEGSLFNVSPLSPGLFFRPPRGSKSPPTGGVLLPTTLEDFDDSVLGDPITYAWCEKFPSGSAFLLDPTVLQTVLASGTFALLAEGTSTAAPPMDSGDGRLLETGLPGCPYRFSESGGLPFTDGNPAYGLQLHHPRFLELVGAPESARLLDCPPTFWVDQLGKEQAMAAAINLQRDAGVMLSNLQILSQFAMVMNRMSFSMMALGLGQSLFPRVEVDDLSPAPRAARAASYMSAMGLWRPQTGPGAPGLVPVSSCCSCMSCKYCFPEDQLPPG